jgi:predicted nucleotidyltransferase
MDHALDTATTIGIRSEIITDQFLAILSQHGVVRAYLFGSVARGTERPDSDVDLLVTFGRTASFLDELRLAEALRQVCGRTVDVLTEVHPAFAPYITPTLVPLPL